MKEANLASVSVRLLGILTVRRAGQPLVLPKSRKVRALIAYLAMAHGASRREQLCELLGDNSSDPRGELRWCLSKIRGIFDQPGRTCLVTRGEEVEFLLPDCAVDASAVRHALGNDIRGLDVESVRGLAALFEGEFADSMTLDRSPRFNIWLTSQRLLFRTCHIDLLKRLLDLIPDYSQEAAVVLQTWLQLAPLDQQAHELLLETLTHHGRFAESGEHATAAMRLFESEGLGTEWLATWRAARNRQWLNVRAATATASSTGSEPPEKARSRRASIAIIPSTNPASPAGPGRLGHAVVRDVTARLAKLRSIDVVAADTLFALERRGLSPEQAAHELGVDYFATVTLRSEANRSLISLELRAVGSAVLLWTDEFDHVPCNTFREIDEVGNQIVAGLASELERRECNAAILRPTECLTAWEAYHGALPHLYRYTAEDNVHAQRLCQLAVGLDPTFGRAHAALSFTHYQNAFVHRTADRDRETQNALVAAARGLEVDDLDPAVHWAMGRAHWLAGEKEACVRELGRAINLCPHYAAGHYMLAFVHGQSGDARFALESANRSLQLSPYDPMLHAKLVARAIAHLRLGEFEHAATWAKNAAGQPNAPVPARVVAAICLLAAGRTDESRRQIGAVQKTHPHYRLESFIESFRLCYESVDIFHRCAHLIGLHRGFRGTRLPG
jgi:DNA-binding SARP family transcriptional activator/TolB-like protein/Flp pilus assembly protein TadD